MYDRMTRKIPDERKMGRSKIVWLFANFVAKALRRAEMNLNGYLKSSII